MEKTNFDTLVVNGPVDLTNSNITINGGQTQEYNAGAGARVKSTEKGVTFTKANGVGTFKGCANFQFRVNGQTSDLAPDNSFSIVFDDVRYADRNDAFPPLVMKLNRNDGSAPANNAWNYDIDNTPLVQVTNHNPLTIRLVNMNAFAHWSIIGLL